MNKFPSEGSSVSFSAGTQRPNPEKWRIVQPNGSEKLSCILARFPDLLPFVTATPVLVNAYPALFSPPAKAVFVDSYGRWQTFCAALALAASHDRPCIIVSMPLTLAHLLLCAVQRGTPFPSQVVLFAGGYDCPLSLELFMRGLLRRAGVSGRLFHLYGVGEIDAGLLAAERTALSPDLRYQPIDPSWHPLVMDGLLCFRHASHPATVVSTGDPAEATGHGIRLHLSSHRLAPDTRNHLENWPCELWERRTGFLACKGSQVIFQCRANAIPIPGQNECEHFDFCRSFGHSWLDKPNWSIPAGL